ncbi:MAG: 50S ribosomal protein L18 [Deltaproteobacteria bacterium]|nr:50S ribosomal protein L18 [Deltaproteobacteria bacterium]
MIGTKEKRLARLRRKRRIRKKIFGTEERPRLCVFKSNRHIYAQMINDVEGITLAAACSLEPEVRKNTVGQRRMEISKIVGRLIAKRALEKGIKKVVFDRNGFLYHGCIKALADAAREEGLQF